MNIDINTYSHLYYDIMIELEPACEYGNIINTYDKNLSYFHIYFNDSEEEKKSFIWLEKDKIKKINLIIDYEVKSF